MRVWHVLVVVTSVACGFLGYRVVVLQNEVDRLSERLGEASGDSGEEEAEIVPLPELASADEEHDRRLDDLEADVQELRADVDNLQDETDRKADLADVQRSASPDRILGVVGDEISRIRDRQLKFHRDRWMDVREQAADDFATRYGLDEHQHMEIRRMLTTEVDDMIDIMKSQAAVDDPERAVSDWAEMMDETDRQAERLLSPQQVQAWKEARAAERKLLMPWLPPPATE